MTEPAPPSLPSELPPTADARLVEMFRELDWPARFQPDGTCLFHVELHRTNRSQQVIIDSKTTEWRGLELRAITSVGFRLSGVTALPAPVAMQLLERNAHVPMGGWSVHADPVTPGEPPSVFAAFICRIPAVGPAELLRASVELVADTADEVERELFGTDHF